MKKTLSILGIATVAAIGVASMHPSDSQLYPNPKYTTGVVATSDYSELTAVSQCGTYSQCHRKTTEAMKKQVCGEYPDNCKSAREIDHYCPLALGCADDIKNLWAQPEHVMVNGEDLGFHAKDKIETYLVNQMKARKMTPSEAQKCILQDWIACYHRYITKNLGAVADPDM